MYQWGIVNRGVPGPLLPARCLLPTPPLLDTSTQASLIHFHTSYARTLAGRVEFDEGERFDLRSPYAGKWSLGSVNSGSYQWFDPSFIHSSQDPFSADSASVE